MGWRHGAFDPSGNNQGSDANTGRLVTASILNVPASVSTASTADPFANLTWGYAALGTARPHAVLSLTGGTTNASFTYDNNGNQTAGLGRTIAYTSYNKPASISQGTTTLAFTDDTEHQRVKQVAPEGTTLYLRDTMGSGLLVEQFASGTVQWNEYLTVAGQVVGVHFTHVGGSAQTRYFHKDNLGSVVALTGESGAVVQRVSYDVWGRIRYASGSPDSTNSIASQTTRAFIGEERLADVGLVHLNARLYDPVVGHFTSADDMVESPYSTQGWNRYAYAGNNPVSFSDPSGQCFLGCFWKPIVHAIGSAIKAINSIPILGEAISIATITVAAVYCGPCAIGVAAMNAALVAGVTSGKLGIALKSGLIAGAVAAASYGIGDLTTPTQLVEFEGVVSEVQTVPIQFGSTEFFENVGLHAALGCVASQASSGGGCGPGALAGGISASSGPLLNNTPYEVSLVSHVVAGGLASIAGGGKFANGAETAAFDYLFNEVQHYARDPQSIFRYTGKNSDVTLDGYDFSPESGDSIRFTCDVDVQACRFAAGASAATLGALLGVPAVLGAAEATGIATTYKNFSRALKIINLFQHPIPEELEPLVPPPPIVREVPPPGRPSGPSGPKPP